MKYITLRSPPIQNIQLQWCPEPDTAVSINNFEANWNSRNCNREQQIQVTHIGNRVSFNVRIGVSADAKTVRKETSTGRKRSPRDRHRLFVSKICTLQRAGQNYERRELSTNVAAVASIVANWIAVKTPGLSYSSRDIVFSAAGNGTKFGNESEFWRSAGPRRATFSTSQGNTVIGHGTWRMQSAVYRD